MADTIKPCPFCGSEDVTIDYVMTPTGRCINVLCCDCTACGPMVGAEPEAIAAWNQRAGEEPHA